MRELEEGTQGVGVISGRFYCSGAGDVHKGSGKIQLSIICADLIAMVTEQRKILIKLAPERERKKEERQKERDGKKEKESVNKKSKIFYMSCIQEPATTHSNLMRAKSQGLSSLSVSTYSHD